ncbi:Uncharacterised protein [Serratia ficaria]|uniref:hypothetical protein n=1 Tax=Serratia ficaria TaxID=61651 RepID=UPI0021829781|nr:hypothetical protein [Serratia ficaria]CAI2504702.1 Uncharacterised protein [Serratia ficaria]
MSKFIWLLRILVLAVSMLQVVVIDVTENGTIGYVVGGVFFLAYCWAVLNLLDYLKDAPDGQ